MSLNIITDGEYQVSKGANNEYTQDLLTGTTMHVVNVTEFDDDSREIIKLGHLDFDSRTIKFVRERQQMSRGKWEAVKSETISITDSSGYREISSGNRVDAATALDGDGNLNAGYLGEFE